MKIAKPWVSKEQFWAVVGGDWTPSAHTHVKANITDTPWAWADVLKAGSNLTDLATRQHAGLSDAPADAHHAQAHAASHHVAGADLLAFASITGFSTYLDQAVKQVSSPTFDDLHSIGQMDFDAIEQDKISLFANRFGLTTMYGFGVEAGTLYCKSGTRHRWYIGANADDGVSDKMELSATGLIINTLTASQLLGTGASKELKSLTTITGLTVGHVLKATGASAIAFQANNLGGLSDITLGTLEEGETLAYDQGSAQWIDAWGVEYDNPRLVWKMYTDFLRSHADASPPWTGVALGGATTIQGGASATHPGVLRLSCSPTARSGYYFMTDVGTFIIGGREHSEFIFKTTASFTDKYVRLGWQDSLTFAAPTDGIFLDLSQNVFSGKTYAAGASSTTATTFNLAANTWYRGTISVNDDVNLITYILYTVVADEQTVVWTNTLATNIPGASLGHGVLAYINVADAAGILIYMDMMVASQAGYITR